MTNGGGPISGAPATGSGVAGPINAGLRPAICHNCGGEKAGPLVPCKACGFVPTGEDRPIAWLFSGHHLEAAELMEAAERIRAGERPDPPSALRQAARTAMGALPLLDPSGKGLSRRDLVGVVVGSLLLTPLVGIAVWFGWREDRPKAAAQALWTSLAIGGLVALAWVTEQVAEYLS